MSTAAIMAAGSEDKMEQDVSSRWDIVGCVAAHVNTHISHMPVQSQVGTGT